MLKYLSLTNSTGGAVEQLLAIALGAGGVAQDALSLQQKLAARAGRGGLTSNKSNRQDGGKEESGEEHHGWAPVLWEKKTAKKNKKIKTLQKNQTGTATKQKEEEEKGGGVHAAGAQADRCVELWSCSLMEPAGPVPHKATKGWSVLLFQLFTHYCVWSPESYHIYFLFASCNLLKGLDW